MGQGQLESSVSKKTGANEKSLKTGAKEQLASRIGAAMQMTPLFSLSCCFKQTNQLDQAENTE
jgi:hypothetical protein